MLTWNLFPSNYIVSIHVLMNIPGVEWVYAI